MPTQTRLQLESKTPEEMDAAAREAVRGGLIGVAKAGCVALVAHTAGMAYSPIYRGLTVQFKVFLSMSVLILGGSIAADTRLKEYEHFVRRQKRLERDGRVLREYDALVAAGRVSREKE
ncbi:MAG: hypothetical protein M1834_000300 [Cirrosporium novae-zelandiae]|nr:MAG: hypothetical protein M1834_000300 [Cirrosporium novae-zelandiae]